MSQKLIFFLGSYVLLGLYWAGDIQATDQVMSPAEFNKALANNELLKKLGKNSPLAEYEISLVNEAPRYANSSGGGIINRPLKEFKGNTMLVGGGKKGGLSWNSKGHNLGVTNIEKILKSIERLKNGNWKFDTDTGKPLDDQKRKELIEKFQKEVEVVLDKYYTVNFAKETEPDLVASITNVNELSSIPNNYFQNVIFENVDMVVWLCPNIFKILERIVKPGGKITIEGAVQPRLLVVAFAHTKWADEVNQQLKKEVASAEPTRSTITFTN